MRAPPHFFKFIVPGFTHKLSIPKSFLKYLKGMKHTNALLKKGHRKWPVKVDTGWFSGEGLAKFLTENGVQEFDFIVFKHEGNMVFDTMVFDPSNCERIHVHKVDLGGRKNISKGKSYHHVSPFGQKFSSFQLGHPPYYKSNMTPHNIKNSVLYIPMKFARSNGLIIEKVHTKIILMDEIERTWRVTLWKEKTHVCLSGLLNFRIENDLKIGDAYKIELIKHGENPMMKFYHLGNSPIKKHFQAKKATIPPHDNHRYFISTLKLSSFKKSYLYLPKEFMRSNGLTSGEMILRYGNQKSWLVGLTNTNSHYLCIGQGFKEFCSANNLKEGDHIKLELIENKKNKIPIANFSNLGKRLIEPHEEKNTTTLDNDHTYFIGTLKSRNMKEMYLPNILSNGLAGKGEIILRNHGNEGSCRTAALRKYKGRCQYYLGREWKYFCIANGLKEGDDFKFELVFNGEKPVAYISRVNKG